MARLLDLCSICQVGLCIVVLMDSSIRDNEITIIQYIRHVLLHWRVIGTISVAAAVVAGLCGVMVTGQVYTARSSLIATGELTAAGELEGLFQELNIERGWTVIKPEVELCKAILSSHTVGERLVKEYDLQGILGVDSGESAIEALAERTNIEVQKPNVVEITVKLSGHPKMFARGGRNDRVRQLAATLANGYIDALQGKLGSLHLSAAKRKRVFLEDKVAESRVQLGNAEQALQTWESENRLINADEAGKLATQSIVNLQQQQEQAELELRTVRHEIAKAEQLLAQQPQMQITSREQEANPLILDLRQQLVQLQADLSVATEIKGETKFHPEVEDIQHQIRTTRQALAEQLRQQMLIARQVESHNPAIDKILEKLLPLQIRKEAVAAKIAGLKRVIDETEKDMMGLSVQAMEYGRLLREVKVREAMYEAITKEYEKSRIAEEGDEPRVHILDTAVAPEGASTPRVGINILLAAFVGMGVGVLWAMSQPLPDNHELDSNVSQPAGNN